jgi:endonuclease-3
MTERTKRVVSKLLEMYPDATTELKYGTALDLLVAVVLSAQTSDAAVNAVTESLFNKYKTAKDYAEASREDLEAEIRPLGLQRNRSERLIAIGKTLVEKFSGQVPDNQKDMESLPGVGRKTAEVVLAVWNKQNKMAVDTHVARVAKRLKLAAKKDTVLRVEKRLMGKVDEELWTRTRYVMLHFGRYHCTAKKPKCDGCPLKAMCRHPHHIFDKK